MISGSPISSLPVSAPKQPPAEGAILASTQAGPSIAARTNIRPAILASTKSKP